MEHGGDLGEAMRRYGGARQDWLDLSAGINPWPWPVPEFHPAAWHRLPARDDEAALIATARAAYRVPDAAAVVPAPGTQATIHWLPFLAPSGPVAVVGPTYGEHARAWARAGHAVLAVPELGDLPPDARHAVLVSPNNPDGGVTPGYTVTRAAERIRERGGWLVVDQSFTDAAPETSVVELCATLPVIVLRSFGKFYGLAGLRLGFAVAAPPVAQKIGDALGPWAVSAPALVIGRAALRDARWADATRRRLAAESAKLDDVLAAGLEVVGGTTLFRLARHDDAHAIHHGLAQRRIWTRRFAANPAWLRFGLPPDDVGRERLATALAEIL